MFTLLVIVLVTLWAIGKAAQRALEQEKVDFLTPEVTPPPEYMLRAIQHGHVFDPTAPDTSCMGCGKPFHDYAYELTVRPKLCQQPAVAYIFDMNQLVQLEIATQAVIQQATTPDERKVAVAALTSIHRRKFSIMS
jgi:hypothetical protein